jgi:hypothetical protein
MNSTGGRFNLFWQKSLDFSKDDACFVNSGLIKKQAEIPNCLKILAADRLFLNPSSELKQMYGASISLFMILRIASEYEMKMWSLFKKLRSCTKFSSSSLKM